MDKTAGLKQNIQIALEFGKQGNMIKSKEKLRLIYELILNEPFILWDDENIADLGKSFLIMNLFDLFEEEKVNICIAHLSYLFLSRALELEQNRINSEESDKRILEISKNRIMLLDRLSDSFTHSLAQFYRKNSKPAAEEVEFSYRIANMKLPMMAYLDFVTLDLLKIDFSGVEFLNELVNRIESDFEISRKDLEEVQTLHLILFHYIKAKVKNMDFDFDVKLNT